MNKNKEMVWVVPRISHARNRLSFSGRTHSLSSKALLSLSTVCTCQSSSASLNESQMLFILTPILIWSVIHYHIWIIRLVVTRLALVLIQKNDWQRKRMEKANQGGHNCEKVLLNSQCCHYSGVSGSLYAQNPTLWLDRLFPFSMTRTYSDLWLQSYYIPNDHGSPPRYISTNR